MSKIMPNLLASSNHFDEKLISVEFISGHIPTPGVTCPKLHDCNLMLPKDMASAPDSNPVVDFSFIVLQIYRFVKDNVRTLKKFCNMGMDSNNNMD